MRRPGSESDARCEAGAVMVPLSLGSQTKLDVPPSLRPASGSLKITAHPVERLAPDVIRAHRAMGMSVRVRAGVDRYLILRLLADGAMGKGNSWRMVGGGW